MANVRKHTITVLALVGAFVIGVFLASGLGTALAGDTHATENATEVTQEQKEANNHVDLAHGKIYMRSLTMGAIMSPEQEAQLLNEAKASEWNNTKFTQLAQQGHEVVDPKTGLTFVIESYKDKPNFVDGITKVYDTTGISLTDLATDKYGEDDFVLDQTVETSFGTLNIYRLR